MNRRSQLAIEVFDSGPLSFGMQVKLSRELQKKQSISNPETSATRKVCIVIPKSRTFREFPNFFAAASPVSTARSIVWLRNGGWRGRLDVHAECSSRRGGDVMMLMLTRVFARAGEHAPRPCAYRYSLRANRKKNVT